MKQHKFMVDTCKGTKYYQKLKTATRVFYNLDYAHTLAQNIDGIWYPISEKIKIGEPEPIRVK